MKTLIETLNNPTEDGLYSLKALAKASGKWDIKKPSQFLRLQSTIDEIKFLSSEESAPRAIMRSERYNTSGGDTFVCRDLVYSYAQWISHAFKFLVIRTFDQLANVTTSQEVIDLKFKLDNALQQDIFTKAQQPRDKNCLQVLMSCSPFQVEHFFTELESIGEVKSRLVPQPPKRIFEATTESKYIIGKKGDTLLFDESVSESFPAQQDWTECQT